MGPQKGRVRQHHQVGVEALGPADQAAIDLELGLADAAGSDAASLTGEVTPPPGQPREQVVQLRELDLGLGLCRPGTGGEDVENHLGPVEDFQIRERGHRLNLGRRKIAVENQRIFAWAVC